MPGGGGTTTSTQQQSQKTEPWAPAVPALTEILVGATKAYQSGVGSQVYGGQRVAGLGSDTLAGLDMLKDAATTGSATAGAANDLVGGLARSGGTTAATQQAVAGFGGINPTVSTDGVGSAVAKLSDPGNIASTTGAKMAGGAYATDTAPVAGLAGDFATGTSQTQRSLQDVADGKFLGGANPYLDEIISRSGNEAATKVAQAFSASGRYGSGRFAGATADAVAGIGSKLRYDDYEAERGRQASAASAIDAAGNARAGLAGSLLSTVAGVNTGNANIAATGAGLAQGALKDSLAGETTLAGLDADNITRRLTQAGTLLSAAQGDRAAGLAAAGQVPTILDALERGGRTVGAVGAAQDEALQNALDSEREVFDETQGAPWKQLGLYAGLVQPTAGLGGTSEGTTTTKTPKPSFLQQLFGAGLACASVASKFMGP